MKIPFHKYDGAGNDFIIIDNRSCKALLEPRQIAHLCHRRIGIGADGLILLNPAEDGYGFAMKYYNSDGFPADMCGNGGRCIVAFAHLLGIGREGAVRFLADDGPHEGKVVMWDSRQRIGLVTLGMKDVAVSGVKRFPAGWLLNTGVSHYVQRVTDLKHYDVVGEGRRIRHLPELGTEGANVNFIEDLPDGRLMVRTYERGVEDETWACGTGVTACAIVTGNHRLCTKGGDFRVDFDPTGISYTRVRLTGPVSLNFTGEFEVTR